LNLESAILSAPSALALFSFLVRLVVYKLCSLRFLFYREGREEHEDNTILPAAGAGVASICNAATFRKCLSMPE
jgi:hypothetical protein